MTYYTAIKQNERLINRNVNQINIYKTLQLSESERGVDRVH